MVEYAPETEAKGQGRYMNNWNYRCNIPVFGGFWYGFVVKNIFVAINTSSTVGIFG